MNSHPTQDYSMMDAPPQKNKNTGMEDYWLSNGASMPLTLAVLASTRSQERTLSPDYS